MNAGAGLYVGGHAHSLEAGIELAMDAMHWGKHCKPLRHFGNLAAGGANVERYANGSAQVRPQA